MAVKVEPDSVDGYFIRTPTRYRDNFMKTGEVIMKNAAMLKDAWVAHAVLFNYTVESQGGIYFYSKKIGTQQQM